MINGRHFFGIILLLIGLSGLFSILGISAYWDQLWPVILIFFGIYLFLNKKRSFGIFIILAGVLFFVAELLNTNAFRLFFPILFIYLGASIFGIAPKLGSDKDKTSKNSNTYSKDKIDDFVIFGGNERNIKSTDFKGGEIVSIFGATKVYLTDCKISKDGGTLDISAIFGGAEIIIPKDMSVIVKGTGVFGGWEDKTVASKVKSNEGTLTISGEAVFGAVTIRH